MAPVYDGTPVHYSWGCCETRVVGSEIYLSPFVWLEEKD